MSTRFIDQSPRGFLGYYWPAFVWMLIPAILLGSGLLLTSSTGDGSLLIIYGLVALVRGLWVGWRPPLDGSQDGCSESFLNAVGIVVLWPLTEFIRQARFLAMARKSWAKGEVLIRQDSGKPARSA